MTKQYKPIECTRFEVIDHRTDAKMFGRNLVVYSHLGRPKIKVTVDQQDGGRTVKVFLDDGKPST